MHNGGINAVAIATPGITVMAVDLLRTVAAITPAKPPKKAINISNTCGLVLLNNSAVSVLIGDTLKKINEANKLATTIIPKFLREVISALKSLEESAYPIPLIGPINGEISIAPMMTAVELLISPIEATMIEQIKIQILMALKEISFLISTMVFSLSTTS